MYLSSTEMVRRKIRPWPLSQVERHGPAGASVPVLAAVQRVFASGQSASGPAARDPAELGVEGMRRCPRARTGRSAALFGSTVSWYCLSSTSSMRPPRRLIEPRKPRGVDREARRRCERSLARHDGRRCPGLAWTVPGAGCRWAVPGRRGARRSAPALAAAPAAAAAGCCCACFCCCICGTPKKVLPSDQHDGRQHDGEQHVLLVVHLIGCPAPCDAGRRHRGVGRPGCWRRAPKRAVEVVDQKRRTAAARRSAARSARSHGRPATSDRCGHGGTMSRSRRRTRLRSTAVADLA